MRGPILKALASYFTLCIMTYCHLPYFASNIMTYCHLPYLTCGITKYCHLPYFASNIMTSLLLAMNLAISSAPRGACCNFARS